MSAAEILTNVADRRSELHVSHKSSRRLSENYQVTGLAGEFEFGVFSGLMPDLSNKPQGDNGTDFVVKLAFSVDVKTFEKPYNLICEQGKVSADIYVLAGTDETSPTGAKLIGWEWGAKLKSAPVKDFGYGVINHYIPAGELRPMDELKDRMNI